MKYLSSLEIAKLWNMSERSVRNYCSLGRIPGAYLEGKKWKIPEDSIKPDRSIRHIATKNSLLEVLKREKDNGIKGGIYHKIQIEMTYNSNHIEGSKLTHDETRYIFETKTIGKTDDVINVDDIIETVNHFACIDLAIDLAEKRISEAIIKQFHYVLKNGTSDSRKTWFKVGDYKLVENEVGGLATAKPENVKTEIKQLLDWYNSIPSISFETIIDFHQRFEKIHPFQDGNGRVGRLIMFKECLKNNIVPTLITDDCKMYYYRGLKEWNQERGYLIDTCLNGQDIMKKYLDYFHIDYL